MLGAGPGTSRAATWTATGLACLALVVVMLGVPLANRLTPGLQPVTPGQRQDVGFGVSFLPAEGWSIDAEASDALGGQVTLVEGNVRFAVIARPEATSADELVSQWADRVARAAGASQAQRLEPTTTEQGLPVERVGARGPERQATGAVVTDGSTSARTLLVGPYNELTPAIVEQADAMVRSIELSGTGSTG